LQIYTKIDLDLLRPAVQVIVNAKQNDKASRFIQANLWEGGQPFAPGSVLATFRVLKPDGTAAFYDTNENGDPAIVIDGNIATIELVEQVLTVPGDVAAELNLYTAGGEKLTSFTFVIRVQTSVLNDAEISSSDYFNVLTNTLTQAQAAADRAEAAADRAEDLSEGVVRSINGQTPDSSGAVSIDVGVLTVNGQSPDGDGNVNVQAGVTSVFGREGAVTAQPGDYNISQITGAVRPNLLDNWYFGNPVNQRGETEYTGITYGIDRWQGATSDTVVTVQNGSVAITGQVYQKSEIPFDNLAGKTVTLSAMEADGTLHNIICIIPTTKPTAYSTIQDTEKLRFAFDGTYFRSQLKSGAFVAAKLELGEGQTLAHQDENENWVLNGIPNYAEELAKCQRYFIRLSGNYDSNGDFVAIGFNNSTNQMRALVTLPATMRAKPVCAFYNIVDKDGANITLNYLGWGAGGSDRYTLVCTMETARTANEINAVRFGANGYIDFDANL